MSTRMKHFSQITRPLSLIIVFSCALSVTHASISIDNYSHPTNDRFTNDPAFIASSFDLSGIGQTSTGAWATAISNNVVISAWHAAPDPGTPVGVLGPDVFFYTANDPSAAPVVRQFVGGSGLRIGSTDIFVGVLNAPLPNTIAHYAIADLSLNGPEPAGPNFFVVPAPTFQDLNAYTFGLSPFDENIVGDNRFAFNDQAVGRNRISGYAENVPFNGADNDSLILLRDPPGSMNYVEHESLFQGGDSGGPTFVEIGGQLVLLGTNAFRYNDNSGSGINYLGNQSAAIRNFIQVNAVPEPASLSLLICFGAIAAARRRRNPDVA